MTLTSVSGDCAWLRIATWLGAWLLRILEYLLTRLQSIQKKKTRKLCIFTSSIKLGQNQFHNTLERVEIGGRVPRLYPTNIVFAIWETLGTHSAIHRGKEMSLSQCFCPYYKLPKSDPSVVY